MSRSPLPPTTVEPRHHDLIITFSPHMSHSSSIVINPPSARKFSRGTPSSDSQLSRYVSHFVMSFRSGVTQPSGSIPPIHILDDDSLLIIFSLYRPVILVGADIGVRVSNSGPPRWGEWTCERWWHELIFSSYS